MRKLFLFIAILLSNFCFSQTPKADSLKQLLGNENNLSTQFILNKRIADELIEKGKLDQVPQYNGRLYTIAAKLKSDSLLMVSYRSTARYLDWKTDSKEALEYLLKALAIAEKKFQSALPSIYNGMGSTYNDLHNYEEGLVYLRKAFVLMNEKGYGSQDIRANMYYQAAYAFNYLDKPDSTLHYTQLANAIYIKQQNVGYQKILWPLTADAYAQLGNYKLAETFFRNSIDDDTSSKTFGDAQAAAAYSKFLFKQNRLQEAKYYALKGLNAALSAQAKSPLIENVVLLRKIYEADHQSDSAYHFAKLELVYRDSLFNQQRLYAVQDLTFKEQVRQQEDAMKKAEEDLQRKRNLQYASIALGVVLLIILFFLFSLSIIANERLIKFLGILALLLVFEFINLFIHPYLDKLTNHSIPMMLLIMVCIAALLIPLHHKLEHWITHKMVEKNKKIRLAAAKKTIATLEG